MLGHFERLLPPYPDPEPELPPKGFLAFVWRATTGLRGYIGLMALLSAGTSIYDALLFALLNLIRARQKGGQPLVYFLLLLATFVLGLVNAFQHAKDAWAVMPAGLVLSAVVFFLSCLAAWVGLSVRAGGVK